MPDRVSDINVAWENACVRLKGKVDIQTFEHWFSSIVPVAFNGGTFVLGVSDRFFADWLQDNYEDMLSEALERSIGMAVKVVFEDGHTKDSFGGDEPDTDSAPVQQKELNSGKKVPKTPSNCLSRHTFANFVVGEENRYAYTAALTSAQSPGGVYNPLYIYGGTGLGKTHLLQAVAHEVLLNNPAANVEYTTCEAFLNNYVDSLRMKKHNSFRYHYRSVDVLLIDDVHQLANKTQLQEEFFNTFNTLHNLNRQIILTSDKQPCEIQGLEDRLVSRFEWGITTEITPPEVETRLAILKMKQNEHLVKISNEVLYFLASRISSSIRRLEGALLRLVAFSSAMSNCEITIETTEGLLGKLLEEEAQNRRVSIESIQKTVASHFDIRVHDILGAKRPRNIAEPRMIAMYLSRELTDYSLPEIGMAFGGRNHATVIHAVKKIEKNTSENEDMRRTVSVIKRELQA